MNDDFDVSKLIRKKKKKINSRTKGNRFENKIAKILNERFNTEDFCRSPGSGAFATTHKLPEHMRVHGDLITPKNFKFTIECKKGYNKESICDIFNQKSKLNSMISQAKRDSSKSGEDFMLIIMQDRKEELVVTNKPLVKTDFNHLSGVISGTSIEILSLKDFLTLPDYVFLG